MANSQQTIETPVLKSFEKLGLTVETWGELTKIHVGGDDIINAKKEIFMWHINNIIKNQMYTNMVKWDYDKGNCPMCKGVGTIFRYETRPILVECENCKGSGVHRITKCKFCTGDNSECKFCHGSGKIIISCRCVVRGTNGKIIRRGFTMKKIITKIISTKKCWACDGIGGPFNGRLLPKE